MTRDAVLVVQVCCVVAQVYFAVTNRQRASMAMVPAALVLGAIVLLWGRV